MGRYRPKHATIIREHEELTIIILYRDTIWVLPKRASTNIIYHRWFSPPLGSFPEWHKFRQKLYTNKHITLEDCYRWARLHEIQSIGTTRAPTIEGKPYKANTKPIDKRINQKRRQK